MHRRTLPARRRWCSPLFDPVGCAAVAAGLAAGARCSGISGCRAVCARAFAGAREANSALTSRIQEILAGIKVVKAYGSRAR